MDNASVRDPRKDQNWRGRRKLDFERQCQLFAVLYGNDFPHEVVAYHFDVTPTTVSRMAGCLARDPHPTKTVLIWDEQNNEAREAEMADDINAHRDPDRIRYYPRVARAFEDMGRDRFLRRYGDPDIIESLAWLRNEMAQKKSQRRQQLREKKFREKRNLATKPA